MALVNIPLDVYKSFHSILYKFWVTVNGSTFETAFVSDKTLINGEREIHLIQSGGDWIDNILLGYYPDTKISDLINGVAKRYSNEFYTNFVYHQLPDIIFQDKRYKPYVEYYVIDKTQHGLHTCLLRFEDNVSMRQALKHPYNIENHSTIMLGYVEDWEKYMTKLISIIIDNITTKPPEPGPAQIEHIVDWGVNINENGNVEWNPRYIRI